MANSPDAVPAQTVEFSPRSLYRMAACPDAELITVLGNCIGFT
jgi:hypothetical protein